VSAAGTGTWKTYTWQLNDAYFGNRQNAAADFRILRSHDQHMFVDTVTVSAR
jgi:hypothetical protein